jgi:quinol monooxygenase YgiN
MILLAGSIRVPAENIEKATPHIQAFVKAVRTEPGCVSFSFAWDVIEPGLLRICEVFENEEALVAHRTYPHVLEWRKIQAEYGFNGRELTKYDVSNATKL